MSRQYHTFLNNYQPDGTKHHHCPPCNVTLAARFIIRTIIPIALGLGAGMLCAWGERHSSMHNKKKLIEISDFISCATTLLAYHAINSLLNCCWPATPYQQTDLFQTTINQQEQSYDNNEIRLLTTECQNA